MEPADRVIKNTSKTIKVDGEVYDEIPQVSLVASKWLVDLWIKLGKPPNPFTEQGIKLMNVIIAVWEDLYPHEAEKWHEHRDEYQKNELTIHQQVKRQTGRSLASFPVPVYRMMRKLFPGFQSTERKNVMKMVRKWPIFQMANRL